MQISLLKCAFTWILISLCLLMTIDVNTNRWSLSFLDIASRTEQEIDINIISCVLNFWRLIWLNSSNIFFLHHISVIDLEEMLQHLISYQMSHIEGQEDCPSCLFSVFLLSWSVNYLLFQLPWRLMPSVPLLLLFHLLFSWSVHS